MKIKNNLLVNYKSKLNARSLILVREFDLVVGNFHIYFNVKSFTHEF